MAQVSDAPNGTGIAGYRGVGASLRARREDLGYDLADVAHRLRIRRAYLDAIEQGQVDDLPGPIYAVGFVRTYADFLGFEPVAAAERFKAELALRLQPTRLSFPTPSPESRAPKGTLIVLGLAIAIGAFAFWQYRQRVDLPDLAIAVPAPPAGPATTSAPAQAPAAPAPATPAPASAAPAPAASAPAASAPAASGPAASAPPAATPAPAERGSPIATPGPSRAVDVATLPPPGSAALLSPAQNPAPAPVPGPVPGPATGPASAPAVGVSPPPAATAGPPPAGTPPAAAAGARVVIRAVADSWVTITGNNNEVIVPGRILRPGDTLRLANRPDATLWTGNLGGLEVLIDDKPIPRLGQSGESRRNVSLDPQRLVAGNAVTR